MQQWMGDASRDLSIGPSVVPGKAAVDGEGDEGVIAWSASLSEAEEAYVLLPGDYSFPDIINYDLDLGDVLEIQRQLAVPISP